MGKRIIDPSIEATTYSVAVTNSGKLAVDWAALAQAKNIEIKFLGNARIQGSSDGLSGWTDTVLSSHAYLRVSTDGGTQWIIFKVSACNGTETLHPALTLTPTPYASLDETNQVLTILAPVTSGTNTGDETRASILAKLGITDISGLNTGDETLSSILTKLGITVLSGSNTGDQNASQVPLLDVAGHFIVDNVEDALIQLWNKIEATKNVYSVMLPSSTTVAGRIAGAVEGTDYPTGWVLNAGVSPVDLYIVHGLNKRVSSISVWAITGTEEQQLFNTAAYNGVKTPSVNELLIQSLATINKAIKIYINFV